MNWNEGKKQMVDNKTLEANLVAESYSLRIPLSHNKPEIMHLLISFIYVTLMFKFKTNNIKRKRKL